MSARPRLVTSADGLADELMATYRQTRKGGVCTVGHGEHGPLIEALRTRGAEFSWIARTLNEKFGVDLKPQTLARHCRRECSCPKS